MSRSYGVREIVGAAKAQNRDIDAQLVEMKKRDARHKEEWGGLQKELQAAWDNLLEQFVPSLEAPALDAASTRLMLPTLQSARVAAAMATERAQKEDLIRLIEADSRFIQKAALGLQHSTRLREMNDFIEPLRQMVDALDAEPHFKQLLADNYGTATYGKGWWTLSYYRDWKNGDAVVEKFGQRMQAKDFAELHARYRDESVNLKSLQAKAEEVTRAQNAINELVQNHARAREAIQKLPERHLTRVRGLAREHLERLDDAERLKLCTTPALELASKRISGVTAKAKYLEGLHEEMVIKPRTDLQRMKAKNEKDVQKLMLPKKQGFVMAQADYDRRFRDRREAWNKRWDRYDNTRTQIIIYDRYDRYDPISNFLWWDVMTDGRLDGNFIPEVYEHHNHYGVVHHHDDAVSAVAMDSSSTLHHSDVS